MKTKKLIESWKNDQTVDNNPAVVNEEVVNQIHGGKGSGGFICTISAECNPCGCSCWPFVTATLSSDAGPQQ